MKLNYQEQKQILRLKIVRIRNGNYETIDFSGANPPRQDVILFILAIN